MLYSTAASAKAVQNYSGSSAVPLSEVLTRVVYYERERMFEEMTTFSS
jgi:hypothetical protein